MAIEDLIARNFSPGTPDTWDAARGRALTLASLLQQNQGGALALQQQRQAVADDQARRAAWAATVAPPQTSLGSLVQNGPPAAQDTPNAQAAPAQQMQGQAQGQPQAQPMQAQAPALPIRSAQTVASPNDYMGQMQAQIDASRKRGDYTYAQQLQTQMLARAKELASIHLDNSHADDFDAQGAKARVETAAQRGTAMANALQSVLSAPPEQQQKAYAREMQRAVQSGTITPEQAAEPFPGAQVLQQHYDALVPHLTRLDAQAKIADESRKSALAPAQLATANAEAQTKTITADQQKRLGMTQHEFDELSETKKRDALNAANAAGHLRVAQGEFGLRQKTFNATIGSGLDASGQPRLDANGKPEVNPLAKAIAGYQMPPISGRAMMSPQGQMLMKQVLAENPDYQGQNFQAYQKTENDAATGQIAHSSSALNTMMGHLSVLNNAADALKSGNVQVLNKLANAIGAQTGSTPQTVYQTIVHRLGPEVTKAYLASGGSVGERGTNEEDFSPNLSPDQIKQNIGISAYLADSKIKANQDQYNRGTYGRGKQKLISDDAEAARQALVKQAPAALTGGGAKAAPSYQVGQTVMYQGAPHKITGIKNGKLVLEN